MIPRPGLLRNLCVPRVKLSGNGRCVDSIHARHHNCEQVALSAWLSPRPLRFFAGPLLAPDDRCWCL